MSRVIKRRNQIRNEDASRLPEYLKAQGFKKRLRPGVYAYSQSWLRDRDFKFWAKSKNTENPEIPGIGIGI